MTNELNISRRKVLAGLGTIGIASAGAGLGTTAFFRDEESVAAELEAGRLDVKLDYRATYNAWLPVNDTAMLVDGPVIPDPDDEMGVIVGQAPDIRDANGGPLPGEAWAEFTRASDACDVDDEATLMSELVRVGEQTDTGYGYRVDGADDYLGPEGQIYVDGEQGLMFDLTDVKPKDEGEATISLHTCGNPAFLWLRALVESSSENDNVEPEVTLGDTDAESELANYIHVRLWDDIDCSNTLTSGPLDVMVVFDTSCSMEYANPFAGCNENDNTLIPGKFTSAKDGAKALADALEPDDQIGLVSYNASATLQEGLAPVSGAFDTAVNGLGTGGNTNIAAGIETAQNELDTNGRPGANPVMVILSDGFPFVQGQSNEDSAEAASDEARDARDAGTTVFTITYQVDGFPIPELVDLMGTGEDDVPPPGSTSSGTFGIDTELGDGFATSSSTALVANIETASGTVTNDAEIIEAFEAVAAFGDENVVYQGSLAGLVAAAGGGIPLRTASAVAGDQPAGDEPQCFDPGVYCYAFDWYFVCEPEDFELPSDVSGAETIGEELDNLSLPRDPNVAQTDTVRFGLDIAATQCRHNMDNANPFADSNGSNGSDDEENGEEVIETAI
jgi:hypothetical protein